MSPTPSLPDEGWPRLLGADPRPWLLESEEPAARWVTLTQLLDVPAENPLAREARQAVLDAPETAELLNRLGDWESPRAISGHDSPQFAPNLLNLLADMGLAEGDDVRIGRMLDAMLEHRSELGRFQGLSGGNRVSPLPLWTSLLCDSHAIIEVLVRFGRGSDERLRSGLERVIADLTSTAQGEAWPCIPEASTGFRGPGRKADFCPQVTLEALRTFARLPVDGRPAGVDEAARAALRAWRRRTEEKPYMFGHGYHFKVVKWPPHWYGIYQLLDTLGRYPQLWASSADPLDRRALAELVKCLVAYNVGPDGRVVPQSCYQGFGTHSFGQKKRPSAIATAWLAAVLRRFDDLAAEAATVDVSTLPSSKGGLGTARSPKIA